MTEGPEGDLIKPDPFCTTPNSLQNTKEISNKRLLESVSDSLPMASHKSRIKASASIQKYIAIRRNREVEDSEE